MTAPLFLLDGSTLGDLGVGDRLVLDGPEGRHASGVMRLEAGEDAMVVDGGGRRAHCRVAKVIDHSSLELEIRVIEEEPLPRPAFVVVQALAKGDRGELAVEILTEIGADEIVPWAASRSVTQWRGERAEKARRKWADTARAAAKQSRRARIPKVAELASTAAVAARVQAASLALLLDEEAANPIAGVEIPAEGEVLVIVGPEGGVAPEEREAFVHAGAVAVRLGPNVLRTSTAGLVALAAVLPRTERWGAPSPLMEG